MLSSSITNWSTLRSCVLKTSTATLFVIGTTAEVKTKCKSSGNTSTAELGICELIFNFRRTDANLWLMVSSRFSFLFVSINWSESKSGPVSASSVQSSSGDNPHLHFCLSLLQLLSHSLCKFWASCFYGIWKKHIYLIDMNNSGTCMWQSQNASSGCKYGQSSLYLII